VAKFIDRLDCILLNDMSKINFSTHNTLTHIDLSLANADIAPELTWKVIYDLHVSDLFSIFDSQKPSHLFSQTNI